MYVEESGHPISAGVLADLGKKRSLAPSPSELYTGSMQGLVIRKKHPSLSRKSLPEGLPFMDETL